MIRNKKTQDILCRGFYPDESGTGTVFVNGEGIKGVWTAGAYLELSHDDDTSHSHSFICDPTKYKDSGVLPNFMLEVLIDTVGRYSGKEIAENSVTNDDAYLHMRGVYQDDLIGIYTISYGDDDEPIKEHIATVRVKFDEQYNMLFADCVKGSMSEIADKCDIDYLDTDFDLPFTFWLEYMQNSTSQFWEWQIIGNVWSNPGLLKGEQL